MCVDKLWSVLMYYNHCILRDNLGRIQVYGLRCVRGRKLLGNLSLSILEIVKHDNQY
jgi:hypothetical protein